MSLKKKTLKHRLTTIYRCDRMWGRASGTWFRSEFPAMRGKLLTFASDKFVGLEPAHYVWLTTNGYL